MERKTKLFIPNFTPFIARRVMLTLFVRSVLKISDNGLRLGEGGDFTTELSYEAHTSNLRKTVIRSTEPPLLPNRCYQLPFCLSEVLSCRACTELLHCPRVLACTLFCFFLLVCAMAKKQM